MQIYFHRHIFSHLSRVPILVEGTVYIYILLIFNRLISIILYYIILYSQTIL